MAKEIAHISKENFLNEADFLRNAIRSAVFEWRMDKVRASYLKHKNSVRAVRELREITSTMPAGEYAQWVRKNTKTLPNKFRSE